MYPSVDRHVAYTVDRVGVTRANNDAIRARVALALWHDACGDADVCRTSSSDCHRCRKRVAIYIGEAKRRRLQQCERPKNDSQRHASITRRNAEVIGRKHVDSVPAHDFGSYNAEESGGGGETFSARCLERCLRLSATILEKKFEQRVNTNEETKRHDVSVTRRAHGSRTDGVHSKIPTNEVACGRACKSHGTRELGEKRAEWRDGNAP